VGDLRFTRRDAVLRGRDFGRVMRAGRKAHTRNFIVFAAPGESSQPRLGLAVGRKVGKAARRNRWKRLVREVFRLRLRTLLAGTDVVVAVKAEVGSHDRPPSGRIPGGYAAVEAELLDGVARFGAVGRAPR